MALKIETLTRDHNRTAFDCGNDEQGGREKIMLWVVWVYSPSWTTPWNSSFRYLPCAKLIVLSEICSIDCRYKINKVFITNIMGIVSL